MIRPFLLAFVVALSAMGAGQSKKASAWAAEGQAALEAKKPSKALAAFLKAVQLDPRKPEYVNGAASAYVNLGKHREAEQFIESKLKSFAKPEDRDVLRSGLVDVLFLWGSDEYDRDPAKGHALFKRSNALAVAIDLDTGATAYTRLADMLRQIGKTQDGIRYYREFLELSEKHKVPGYKVAALAGLANCMRQLSEYDECLRLLDLALPLALQQKDDENLAILYVSKAFALDSLGRGDEALPLCNLAIDLARRTKSPATEASALTVIAQYRLQRSDYPKALEASTRAADLFRRAEQPNMQGKAVNIQGLVQRELGQFDLAVDSFTKAINLLSDTFDKPSTATACINLGMTLTEAGFPKDAIEPIQMGIKALNEVGDPLGEAVARCHLGQALGQLGKYDEAISQLLKARRVQQDGRSYHYEAATLTVLGSVRTLKGDLEQANKDLHEALLIHRRTSSRIGEAAALSNLMANAIRQDRLPLAAFYGKSSIATLQSIREDMKSLSQEQRQSFLSLNEPAYRMLADTLVVLGRLPEAQQVLTLLKQEEFCEFTRAGPTPTEATLSGVEAEWKAKYNAIADKVTALGQRYGRLLAKPTLTPDDQKELDGLEEQLAVANRAFEQFLVDLAKEFATVKVGADRVAVVKEARALMSDLQELGPGTVAVYTIAGTEKLRLVLVTPTVVKSAESRIGVAELNQLVQKFREQLQNPTSDPRAIAKKLYDVLVGPIAKDLEQAQAETIMWSLDGSLRYVPVAALYDGKNWLVERFRCSVFTPASNARLKDVNKQQWTALAFGVSTPHPGFSALPGVKAELDTVVKKETGTGVVPGEVILDDAFTEESLRRSLRGGRHPLVHIASHFSFAAGNETSSFLLLGDGTHLSLDKIGSFPSIFQGVDLLTLSACNTAVGSGKSGREVEGFGMLAQELGAKAVLASLWPVADRSTPLLMGELYRLRTAGSGKSEALRQAQVAFISGKISGEGGSEVRDIKPAGAGKPFVGPGKFSHPFYWAPFILIGNWK